MVCVLCGNHRADRDAPSAAAGLARSPVKMSTQVKDETHDRLTSTVSFWSSIGFYSLCSSSMLLVNKMVLARLPYASTLSLIQICAAVVFIQAGSYGNVLKDVDPLEKHKVGPYLFYVFLFALALLTNMKSLEVANVETVIVFRSLTPAAVAVLDPAFLGKALGKRLYIYIYPLLTHLAPPALTIVFRSHRGERVLP